MLDIKWYAGLRDSDIVNPFINQSGVYTGCFGHVYRHNSENGSKEASNGLDTIKWGEVRLAGPTDASLLIADCTGFVFGLDPISLNTVWKTALGTSNETTSVLCAKNAIYVTASGEVFRLDYHGKITDHNPLPGYSRYEARLGITTSESSVFVGINGYIACLDPKTLEVKWWKEVPSVSGVMFSVIGGTNVVYGGCYGRVFKYDESGNLLYQNDLPSQGETEVRMVLDSANSLLYVGTNGYGNCLKASDLTKVYATTLSDSREPTDVAVGDGSAYFSCYGHVFVLDDSGEIVARNDLPGYGNHVTRVTTSSYGPTELVLGINGWAVGLNVSSFPKPVDFSGVTYPVLMIPYTFDLLLWRSYDPSTIQGVGMLLGSVGGKLIGTELYSRTCEYLKPNSDGNSYTYVFTPDGAIIYKYWDHDDRDNYTRHSQLGQGKPVICAGEFRYNQLSFLESVIGIVNDASGHYKPDGGACLRFVSEKLEQIGIDTSKTNWYFK